MSLLKPAMEDLGLSACARRYGLAGGADDCRPGEGAEEIKPAHIAEAVGYRSLDRSVWAQEFGWKAGRFTR